MSLNISKSPRLEYWRLVRDGRVIGSVDGTNTGTYSARSRNTELGSANTFSDAARLVLADEKAQAERRNQEILESLA